MRPNSMGGWGGQDQQPEERRVSSELSGSQGAGPATGRSRGLVRAAGPVEVVTADVSKL